MNILSFESTCDETAVALGLLALREPVAALGSLLSSLGEESGLSAVWFTPLYKTLGIALVVRIGSDLCRDARAEALAGVVETAGTVMLTMLLKALS